MADNPWALLVAAIFLNVTNASVARPYIKAFFEKFPDQRYVVAATVDEVAVFFKRLGLPRRARNLWHMSRRFEEGGWERVDQLPGVGKYGKDVFDIFYLGNVNVQPTDKYLKKYVRYVKFNRNNKKP